jgi:hypothetical protein
MKGISHEKQPPILIRKTRGSPTMRTETEEWIRHLDAIQKCASPDTVKWPILLEKGNSSENCPTTKAAPNSLPPTF